MTAKVDLTGQRFGRWTVLKEGVSPERLAALQPIHER